MNNAIHTYRFSATIFCVAALLFFLVPNTPIEAASTLTLSKSDIEQGEFFDIYGTGFGAGTSSYSYVCFKTTDLCVKGSQIAAQPPMSWSDTQIHMQLPSGVPIEGDIIVVGEGAQSVCSADGTCQTSKYHQDKGRAAYKVKPKINTTVPNSAIKPGDSIKIVGNGFGDTTGTVFFDDVQASILSWSYTAIEVRASSSLSKRTQQLRVVSVNGLQAMRAQLVTTPITNDEFSYLQYYLSQVNVPEMWHTPPKKQVIVAVLDDGVYANHPDLKDHIWQNKKEIPGNGKDDDENGFIDDYLGYNFLDHTANVDPKGGHGTFVAGIIGAVRDNGIGIAGIADAVKIMPVIISDGKTSNAELVKEGIEYAIDNGADVINISFASIGTLGFFQKDSDIFQKAFDKGVIVVVAAGNRDIQGGIGQNLNLIPESPVCNNNGRLIMLGVAALDNTDAASDGKKKASWASYGSNCVAVSAPGTSIVSTVPPLFQKEGKFYDTGDGSSFAAPIVTGIAAYLKSVHPEWTQWDIMNRIIATAQNNDPYNPGYEGQIGGRIDAQAALDRTSIQPKIISFSDTNPRAGDTIHVQGTGFISDFSLHMTDNVSVDMPIPAENSTFHAADEFDLLLPRTLQKGTYYLRVVSPTGGEVGLSQQSISVQDALPIQVEKSIITVPTYLVPSFTAPISINFPSTQNPAPAIQNPASLPQVTVISPAIAKRLSGGILLQTQSHGEAWYISPIDLKRYYLGRPSDAFSVMRKLGLGVTHQFIAQYSVYPARVVGRIILDVDDSGKAYYIYPKDKKAYYMGKPADAFMLMRRLGLGITNADLFNIPEGAEGQF